MPKGSCRNAHFGVNPYAGCRVPYAPPPLKNTFCPKDDWLLRLTRKEKFNELATGTGAVLAPFPFPSDW